MSHNVYLSLGSNLGNREGYLTQAIAMLAEDSDITVKKISSIYETAPVGYLDQPSFLNLALFLETNLSPDRLLSKLHAIEKDLDRKRVEKWGPRTIDLDILLYNNESIQTEHLMIPHPRMRERSFVLIPLSEIAPDLLFPDAASLNQVLCELRDKEGVRLWKKIKWADAYGLIGS